jgi:PAS domain-containing protein
MLHCKNSSEIIGREFADTIAPESLPVVRERIEMAAKMPNLPMQIKVKRQDGSIFISESNSVPFVFNKQPAVLVIGRDITAELEQKNIVQKEEKLRTDILNSFKEVVAFYNPDHQIIWLNEAGKRQLNLTDDSYMGKKCHMVWFGSKSPCPTCPMVHHKDEIKERIVTFPDQTIWRIRHTPLYDNQGIITGYIEYREDVTEKEHIKIEFEKSHSRLVNAEIANKFGHIEYDLSSQKLVLSQGVFNILGLPFEAEKLKLNDLAQFVDADDLSGLKEVIYKALNSQGKFQYVFNINDQCVNEKIIRGIGHLNNGKFFGVIQDVTSFIQLEKQLRDEREKYKMLAENTPFWFDTDPEKYPGLYEPNLVGLDRDQVG